MRGDVIEIRARGGIILIGGAGALSGLPETLRQRSAGCSAIRHLSGETQAIHELRHFWLRRSHPHSIGLASDRELLKLVAVGVACGDVQVVVLPAHHARVGHVPQARAAAAPPGRIAQVAGPAVVRAPAAAAPPTAKPPAAVGLAAAPAPRMVSRMRMEERLAEVLRRAAALLPRTMGAELLALVTPESIATALGLAAVGAAANLTPFGWAADVVLAAIAFGFGGLAAVHALGDLVVCFELIASAEAERDLDEAAEAFARAASAITVAGLMAILHEKAKRWGGGGEGRVEQIPPDVGRARAAGQHLKPRSEAATSEKTSPTVSTKASQPSEAFVTPHSPDKPLSDYGVAFFGEDNLGFYDKDQATLGAPGRSFFLMPSEDSAAVRNAATAARETGMSPSTLKAYREGKEIYGITFPTNGMQLSKPTAADARGYEHFLEGGHTAVKLGDGPNAGFLVNTTREFVTPGGKAMPTGSVLFKLGPSGEWIQMRRF